MNFIKVLLAAWLGFLLGSAIANADVVFSAAMKHGPSEKQVSNNSTTVNGVTSSTQNVLQNTRTDLGILLQVMPTYTGMAAGVSIFTDGTTLVTIGIRID